MLCGTSPPGETPALTKIHLLTNDKPRIARYRGLRDDLLPHRQHGRRPERLRGDKSQPETHSQHRRHTKPCEPPLRPRGQSRSVRGHLGCRFPDETDRPLCVLKQGPTLCARPDVRPHSLFGLCVQQTERQLQQGVLSFMRHGITPRFFISALADFTAWKMRDLTVPSGSPVIRAISSYE